MARVKLYLSIYVFLYKVSLFLKLKKVDEVSYHLYNVELLNRYKSKEKSKLEIKDLLEQILINETILNEDIKQRIQQQINNY
jgi:predicted restriction endonuclease